LLLTYSSPFVVSGDKDAHTVLFASADKLTNTEAFKSTSFKIDATPPTLTATGSDGTFSYTQDELVGGLFTNASSLAVSYAASDGLSGMYAVRIDGTTIPSSARQTWSYPAASRPTISSPKTSPGT